MPHRNSIDDHGSAHHHLWLFGGVMFFCVLILTILVGGLSAQENPSSDLEYAQVRRLEQRLGVAQNELIMLIISLVVVVQIVTSIRFLRWLPQKSFLLCSFGAMALSAVFTVAEGFVFSEVLNYLEHLSFMTSAILLAIWCWQVFGSKKQEGS